MKIKYICFCTHLHENAKKRKKTENAKEHKKTKTQKIKRKKKRRRICSGTKTHIFKNEDAKKNENANSRRTMST